MDQQAINGKRPLTGYDETPPGESTTSSKSASDDTSLRAATGYDAHKKRRAPKPRSFRLGFKALRHLDWLADALEVTKATIVQLAIMRLYWAEKSRRGEERPEE